MDLQKLIRSTEQEAHSIRVELLKLKHDVIRLEQKELRRQLKHLNEQRKDTLAEIEKLEPRRTNRHRNFHVDSMRSD